MMSYRTHGEYYLSDEFRYPRRDSTGRELWSNDWGLARKTGMWWILRSSPVEHNPPLLPAEVSIISYREMLLIVQTSTHCPDLATTPLWFNDDPQNFLPRAELDARAVNNYPIVGWANHVPSLLTERGVMLFLNQPVDFSLGEAYESIGCFLHT